MVEKTVISFRTHGVEGDERFIREYVLPAMERLPTLDSCDNVGFLRYGHNPQTNHGEVRLHLSGTPETIVEQEQERWNELIDEDLTNGWETVEENDQEKFGSRGAELSDKLTFLSSKMSKLAFEEFDTDEFPAPVDTYPTEGPIPIGWWGLYHFLSDQQAHSPNEEIDTHMQGIWNELFTLGGFHGYERASTRIDDLIENL